MTATLTPRPHSPNRFNLSTCAYMAVLCATRRTASDHRLMRNTSCRFGNRVSHTARYYGTAALGHNAAAGVKFASLHQLVQTDLFCTKLTLLAWRCGTKKTCCPIYVFLLVGLLRNRSHLSTVVHHGERHKLSVSVMIITLQEILYQFLFSECGAAHPPPLIHLIVSSAFNETWEHESNDLQSL